MLLPDYDDAERLCCDLRVVRSEVTVSELVSRFEGADHVNHRLKAPILLLNTAEFVPHPVSIEAGGQLISIEVDAERGVTWSGGTEAPVFSHTRVDRLNPNEFTFVLGQVAESDGLSATAFAYTKDWDTHSEPVRTEAKRFGTVQPDSTVATAATTSSERNTLIVWQAG